MRIEFSTQSILSVVTSVIALLLFPGIGHAQVVKYDSAMAVDDKDNIYILEDNAKDANLKILKISPYNQVEEYYKNDWAPEKGSDSPTRIGKILDESSPSDHVDDLWWDDGNLYLTSGRDVYRLPHDKSKDLNEVSAFDKNWYEERVNEDSERERQYTIWKDTSKNNQIIVEEHTSKPTRQPRTNWQKEINSEIDSRNEKKLGKDREYDDREWMRRLDEMENNRRREIEEIKKSVRQSVTRMRGSIHGFTRNQQSQSAFTDGSAFSEQHQSQSSDIDYEFSFE